MHLYIMYVYTLIKLQLGDDTFGHSTLQNFRDNGIDVCLVPMAIQS